MKKLALTASLAIGLAAASLVAQEEPNAANDAPADPAGLVTTAAAKPKKPEWQVVIFGSGWLGTILWMALFGTGIAAIYFIVDSMILVRPQKIMPDSLIGRVREAMAEGDVVKAIKACDSEPGALANILSSGFAHVEEGYDIIQEAVGNAADLETERLMQRLTWISVCANIAPMLGLLGTVQGMIMAFANMGAGQVDISVLSVNIGQALWTTAAGLVTAIPSVTFYYGIRNNANRLVLRMEAMTMELIKDLRNVEVVNG